MGNLSTILSNLMSANNISSAELARKTDIGQPVIYRLMTGATENPQVLTLKPIAEFFGVTVDQLTGFSSFNESKSRNLARHEITNKLATIKTISSALVDILPSLVRVYEKATSAKLVKEDISLDMLPLLLLNSKNLVKTINQLQDALTNNPKK